MTDTKWFVKMPDGDTYYGRIYHGKVYELVPAGLPYLTIEDGGAYVEEGLLEYYTGLIFKDSDANAVLADEGKSVLKYTGSSGNLGGYVESFYTASRGRMKATVMIDAPRVIVDLEGTPGDVVIDRETLRGFLSFIATALIGDTLSSVNLQNDKYKDYINGDAPVPVSKPKLGLQIKLERLPAQKVAGF